MLVFHFREGRSLRRARSAQAMKADHESNVAVGLLVWIKGIIKYYLVILPDDSKPASSAVSTSAIFGGVTMAPDLLNNKYSLYQIFPLVSTHRSNLDAQPYEDWHYHKFVQPVKTQSRLGFAT